MPTHVFHSALITLFVCCSIASIGCGGYRTYPVQGTAKLKDGSDIARLAGHAVMFEATEAGPDGKVASATGEIGADGKFLLSTNATNDGAYPGKYRVAVTAPDPPVDAPRPPAVIHLKYRFLLTSGLEATVEAKSTQTVTLELDPPGK